MLLRNSARAAIFLTVVAASIAALLFFQNHDSLGWSLVAVCASLVARLLSWQADRRDVVRADAGV